jgi:hypothetical protein
LEDQAEKLQQMLLVVESADASLGEDLWLIAERILLYRLTRAGDKKRTELAAMVHLLRRIISETNGEQYLPIELIQLDADAANGFAGSADGNLSLVFTTIVDLAESMTPDQLYLFISALKKMELPEQDEIDLKPLDKAEEFLTESFQDENSWEL